MRLGNYEAYTFQDYRRILDDSFIYLINGIYDCKDGMLEVEGRKVSGEMQSDKTKSEEKFRFVYKNIAGFLKEFKMVGYGKDCGGSKRDLAETMSLKLSELYVMSESVMSAQPPRNHYLLHIALEREIEFMSTVGRLFGRWLDHPCSNPYSVFKYAPGIENIDFAEAVTIVANEAQKELLDWCEKYHPSSTELINNIEGKIRLHNHTDIIDLADKFFGNILCWCDGKYDYYKENWQNWKIDVMADVQKYNTREGITPVDKLPLDKIDEQ